MGTDLISKGNIKRVLKEYDIKPQKRLGQNFLVSKQALNKIIAAADLKPKDTVLEVGPGLGALTIALAQRVKKVVAVEKDRRLAAIMKEILKHQNIKNVEIIESDILKYQIPIPNWFKILRSQDFEPYKVAANLPYNIAAAVVMKFLEAENPPQLMVVMLQKEVGQRICSRPPKMSKLGVFCQFYGKPEIIAMVSKKSFYPQPKVDSVILKISPNKTVTKLRDRTVLLQSNVGLFSRIVRAGFSHPRKQLLNNLSRELGLGRKKVEKWLLKNGINPTQRAETLTVDNWLKLTIDY